jgi:ferrous iron transport protein B
MSCSARIPVYVVLIAAFVPATMVLGFLPLQGIVFVSMYLVGVVVAIPTAFLLKRTVCRSDRPSFLVELPPYRLPDLRVVLRRMYESGQAFVVRAGTLIFAATILIWALSYFPRHPDPGAGAAAAVAVHADAMAVERERRDVERARQEQAVAMAEAQSPGSEMAVQGRRAYEAYLAWSAEQEAALAAERAELEAQAERTAAAESLAYSALGRAGKFVEPVFAPLGWDWRVSVAVLASFPAREVFISSLGVIYQLGGDVDEENEGLRQRMRASTWESGPRRGEPVLNLANAIALMVFFALCAQCVSTLVTIRKEAGHWGWAAFSFVYMTALAWIGALVTVLLLGGRFGG